MSLDYFLKLKRNQIKMVKARGYDVSSEEWILDEKLNGKKFKEKLSNKYDKSYNIRRLLFSEYSKNEKHLFVFFVGLEKNSKQIKIESLTPFIDKLTRDQVKKNGLLIINADLSPSAANLLANVTESCFQVIKEDALEYNIIEHMDVPKHELLTNEETDTIKKSMCINGKSLPIIHHDDPISAYYNFLPGQFIKITTNINIDTLLHTDIRYCIVV